MTGTGTVSIQDSPACVTPKAGVTVVALRGDIDLATADLLEDALAAGIEGGSDVFVHLADVTLIDGASLSVLVRAGRAAERRGQTVHLVAPSRFVQRILAAAELDQVFPVLDSAPNAYDRPQRRTPATI